jgi:hypothetical protein
VQQPPLPPPHDAGGARALPAGHYSTLLDQAITPAEAAFGRRDKAVVEVRAARADILLEAAEYQNALDAYTQLRPDAVYSYGPGDSLVSHIEAGIEDCEEWQ